MIKCESDGRRNGRFGPYDSVEKVDLVKYEDGGGDREEGRIISREKERKLVDSTSFTTLK